MAPTSSLLTSRSHAFGASGIRKIVEMAARMPDAVNLSIGQPDFEVPEIIRAGAVEAIGSKQNGYSLTQGVGPLRSAIASWLARDIGWDVAGGPGGPAAMVTSGTSGALVLAFMCLMGPGDEAVIPDPYFVMYPVLGDLCGGRCVPCDTYPDFRMTAERVEPLLTARTKAVLLNSPGNPSGVVMSEREVNDLLDLCRSRGVLLISDEIYDEFTFSGSRTQAASDAALGRRCPSPCRVAGSHESVLLIRGFGKTYGVTGWRLGFAAGPSWLIDAMTRMQQYTFVCAPTPLQAGAARAFEADISRELADYEARRDMVVRILGEVTEVAHPGGAFYAFPRVPPALGMTGTALAEALVARGVLVIPGRAFSPRDTHIRLSFSAPPDRLERGVRTIADVMRG